MLVPELILIVLSLLDLEIAGFSHTDLLELQPSCATKYSCASYKRNQSDYQMDWVNQNCFCDNLCSEYGDCCLDSDSYVPDEEKISFHNYQCFSSEDHGDLYMKVSCMPGWLNESISEECYKGSFSPFSFEEHPVYLPVTSKISNVTYKNYFCAVCNEDTTSLEFWMPHIECNVDISDYNDTVGDLTVPYMLNNLVHENGAWGIYLDSESSGNSKFHTCRIVPQLQNTTIVNNLIRKCKCTFNNSDEKKCIRPVSTCSSKWADPIVGNLCNSYTAIVYGNENKVYRNIHCAICNNIEKDLLDCNQALLTDDRIFSWIWNTIKNIKYNLSILFDIFHPSGNNDIGSDCPRNYIRLNNLGCRKHFCQNQSHEYRFGSCMLIQGRNANPMVSTMVSSIANTLVMPDVSLNNSNTFISTDISATTDTLETSVTPLTDDHPSDGRMVLPTNTPVSTTTQTETNSSLQDNKEFKSHICGDTRFPGKC